MQILSHNCYWFQGHPFDTDAPGAPHEEIFPALVALYRRIGADLVCLQEVQDEATSRRLAGELGMDGRFTPGGELLQYGGAVLWREGGEAATRRVQVVGAAEPHDGPAPGAILKGAGGELVCDSGGADPPPQRMWQLIRSASGLVVANVHLPSSRQLGRERAAAARVAEMESVLGADTSPDVVLGDFNEQPGGPVGRLLSSRGYLDAAVLHDCAARPTALGGGRGDQIWIREGLRGSLVEYTVPGAETLATGIAGKESLSDHLPLWVILDVEGEGEGEGGRP